MKEMNKYFLIITFIISIFIIVKPANVYASSSIGNWTATTSLPYSLASHVSYSNSNKIFIIGGSAVTGESKYGPISATQDISGALSTWNSVGVQFPAPLIYHSLVQTNHYVYILGGLNENIGSTTNFVKSVYLGIINQGSISSWTELENLPNGVGLGAAVVIGNKIYYAGGTDRNQTFQNIYIAQVNSENGTIGPWSVAGQLPLPLSGFGMIANGNELIVIGGQDDQGNFSANTYTTTVNSDGTIGNWQQAAPLPEPIYRGSIAQIGSLIVSLGGSNENGNTKNVYYTTIQSDGTLAPWTTSQSQLPQSICCGAVTVAGNYIYLTGGYSSENGYLDTVYFSQINPPAVSGQDLNVPLLKQISDPWQSHIYDSANIWNPSGPTINRWGCALTSAAMILKYYGYNKLPDGTPLDPGTLNTWLDNQTDGYINEGWLNWLAISRLSKLAAGVNHISGFDALEYQHFAGSDINTLTNDLNAAVPAILEEPGHFIVAKGVNNNTYDINDPYYNRTTLQDGYNNTFVSLGTYTKASTNLSYIMAVTDQDTDIKLFDANGDPLGNEFLQQPIKNPANSNQTNGKSMHIFYLAKPANGVYKIQTSSTQTGQYQIQFYLYDTNGNVVPLQISDILTTGTPNMYTLDFSADALKSDQVYKIVSFQSVIDDIRHADTTHQLNHILAATLISTINNAQKYININHFLAQQSINAGLILLNKSQRMLMTHSVYLLLHTDFLGLKQLVLSHN